MRRVSEYIYTLMFFGCGLWALSSGLTTLFGGLNDLNMTGTWASALMVVSAIVIRLFGSIQHKHTKTLVFLGFTSVFGGVWGIGTVLVILSGALMLSRGFKQLKVLKGQTTLRELRQIRKEKLAELEAEENHLGSSQDTKEDAETKRRVSEELLEGFVGSDDYRREIKTWINEQEFETWELTPEEIRAKAKQEIRKNKLSLETLLALEELDKTRQQGDEDVDLTFANLDLPTEDENFVSNEVGRSFEDYEEDNAKEMTLEELLEE